MQDGGPLGMSASMTAWGHEEILARSGTDVSWKNYVSHGKPPQADAAGVTLTQLISPKFVQGGVPVLALHMNQGDRLVVTLPDPPACSCHLRSD